MFLTVSLLLFLAVLLVFRFRRFVRRFFGVAFGFGRLFGAFQNIRRGKQDDGHIFAHVAPVALARADRPHDE